jgi:AcrR family transcriptional regulator
MAATTGQPGRGRPRDPDLERRVLEAALVEYARTGWAGFTMHGVAGRAGVGKSALYLRWPTKEKVLVDAIEAHTRPLAVEPDTGSLRGDALKLAANLLAHFLDPTGWVTLRIAVDASVEAVDLAQFQERITKMHNRAARRLVDRAVERGELPVGVDSRAIIEALFGGVLIRALALPARDRAHVRATIIEQVTPLVDLILAGASALREPRPTAAAT